MLKSMTAYGRTSLSTSVGSFTVEIQSVNRKHLEINVFLPRELSRFESDIRKMINKVVTRGQVSVKVFANFERSTPVVVTPNLPLAKQLKSAWETIAKELKLDASQAFSLNMLLGESGVICYGEDLQHEETYRTEICQAVDGALKDFMRMRVHEGESLQRDIEARLINLRRCLNEIAKLSPNATEKYRQKLMERLQEILPGAIENEERILREVCLYAEKIDITEEITRFFSHLHQCETLLKGDSNSVGKTFEFLLQELGREINTIGSKSSDVDVSRLVIEVKSELEKIREQIQNIE